ncbi:MAG TPA: hypothetical protein VH723_02725 [Candidatus Limnocylindrales bacterium]
MTLENLAALYDAVPKPLQLLSLPTDRSAVEHLDALRPAVDAHGEHVFRPYAANYHEISTAPTRPPRRTVLLVVSTAEPGLARELDLIRRVAEERGLELRSLDAGEVSGVRADTTYLADGQVKQTAYSDGNPLTLRDTIDATYDTMGRPDQLKRGTTVLSDFNWNADGTLASRVDGDAGAIGTTTFGYDWADRLVSANLPDTFSTAVPTLAWRADGLIKERKFASGSTPLTFSYDRAKRPTRIDKGAGFWLTQEYDADGNS